MPILFFLFSAMGLLICWLFHSTLRLRSSSARKLFVGAQPAKCGEVADGAHVLLKGKVVVPDDWPEKKPVWKRTSTYRVRYDPQARSQGRDPGWELASVELEHHPFDLDDGTGRVRVNPECAWVQMRPSSKESSRLERVEVTTILPGDKLLVVGIARAPESAAYRGREDRVATLEPVAPLGQILITYRFTVLDAEFPKSTGYFWPMVVTGLLTAASIVYAARSGALLVILFLAGVSTALFGAVALLFFVVAKLRKE